MPSAVTGGDGNADHATITIMGPQGPAYIRSRNRDKVEIGSINIGNGSGVEIHSQGSAAIGELNVGMPAILASHVDEPLASENGTFAVIVIASVLIVFALIGVLGWRALSVRPDQRR